MAMLGNAAGTVARAYAQYFPQTRIDGVEIDGALSDLGRRMFGMDRVPNLRVFDEDARPFLRRTDSRYDIVTIDAYRQPYIPFYLTTREFFQLARSRLNRGGAVVVNVGHPPGDTTLEEALTATLRDVFPNVVRYPVKDANTLLVASFAPLTPADIERASSTLPTRAAVRRPGRLGPPRRPSARRLGLHRRPGTRRVADRRLAGRVRDRRRLATTSRVRVVDRTEDQVGGAGAEVVVEQRPEELRLTESRGVPAETSMNVDVILGGVKRRWRPEREPAPCGRAGRRP